MFLTEVQENINYDIYVIVAALFVLGIIIMIVNGALWNKSLKTKGIVFSIVSLLYSVIFVVALIIDVNSGITYPKMYYGYFIGTGILYFLLFGVSNLVKKQNKFIGIKQDKKMVYTYMPKEEHVYIVFKYEQSLYLNNETNCGIDYELKKSEFTDECISKILNKYQVKLVPDVDRLGMLTVKKEKKDIIYYCYLIEINEQLFNDEFKNVSLYDIVNLDIPEIDKYIIFNCLRGEEFDKIF